MGYTLYVDGSIEAELPQGTLRFASINELRSHLEKNVLRIRFRRGLLRNCRLVAKGG